MVNSLEGKVMSHIFNSTLAVAIISGAIAAFCQTRSSGQSAPPTSTSIPGSITTVPSKGEDARSTAPAVASQHALLTRAKAEDGARIGGGDLLQVTVFGASDYNYDVRVAGDGFVNLPFVGLVHVSGLTTRQAESDLQSRLSQGGYFNNPQVGVFVKEYATQGVTVLGEVQKPGVYPLLGTRTLFDMLSSAQGTTQTAGDKVSVIHRDRPQQPEIVKLSYDGEVSPQSNVPVFPGDTIVVQKAGMVYVVGDVQKPSGILMANPQLTVLKAIALAQGTNPNASLEKARLVRKTSDGQVEIPLHLKQMLAAKVPDMRVEPEDIIFIPNSALKTGVKHGMEAALATVTGVVIYRR
jgi:polysaccharide biosynthesis/export protein